MGIAEQTYTRRAVLASALGLLLLPSCSAPLRGQDSSRNSALQEAVTLLIGGDETSRRVAWRSDSSETASVRWAKKDSYFELGWLTFGTQESSVGYIDVSEEGRYGYVASMTGLEPDTAYVYCVVNGDTVSETYEFKTTGIDDFTFVFVGDPQIGENTDDGALWEELSTKAFSGERPLFLDNPAFLLTGGDNINSGCSADSYDVVYEDWYASLSCTALKSYAFAPAIGNHEALHSLYREYYPLLMTQADAGTTLAGSDWWFSYNGVLFAVLNGTANDIESHVAFLESAVRENESASWKIAVIHQNLFSVHQTRNTEGSFEVSLRNVLAPCFTDLGFDLILSGHDHIYQRSYVMEGLKISENQGTTTADGVEITAARGPVYVSGNGSVSKFYLLPQNIDEKANAVAIQTDTPHFSRVDVTDDRLSILTYCMSTDELIDSVTLYR